MPINDLISREAAIAAVRDAIVSSVSYEIMQRARDAIAALPADRSWEELRSIVQNLSDSWQGLTSLSAAARDMSYRRVLQEMDRLAPPADGAENT